ncbi:DUF6493 family protein [Nonomuraea sp. LP-02]|uniref:DUF6493 family protein n=1 Tax=Nonomuraea sp. LP-02 TaxID=3097960 RepID=UPI002E35E752|nr:DUF6493 family protein [Nonomuraea sp. LP-02]MED7925042.1 DUF6493 family protein [Nonomuraea sp. LP-02]
MAIDSGDPGLVAEYVLSLDAEGRKAVAAALPGHLSVVRGIAVPGQPSDETWIDPMRVAGAGTISGAAATVAWLNRRDFQDRRHEAPDATPVLVRVLSARPPAWQADFATRAALRLPGRTRGSYRRSGDAGALALAMLRHTGVTPPEHDPLVVEWAARPPTADRLRRDPLLGHLLPRLFEAEGVGRALRDERGDRSASDGWLAALTTLASEGGIDRDLLLDGCVRRFLRGGPVAGLRFFARLHERLEPTYDEVRERAPAYLRLLPAAPGSVADLALRHLRRLAELGPEDVGEAVRALLPRPERKLVTAGLVWLDEYARDRHAGLDTFAPALADAFRCPSADVQGRAVRLAVTHARQFGPGGVAAVRAGARVLPRDLAETLAAAFGGEAHAGVRREDDGFVPVPLPAPRLLAPLPPAPRTAADLAELPQRDDWQAMERWLAGVVRLHGEDPGGLAAALAGRAARRTGTGGPRHGIEACSEAIVALVADGSMDRLVHRPVDKPAGESMDRLAGGPADRPAGGPEEWLVHRSEGLLRGPSDESPDGGAGPLAGGPRLPAPHLFLLSRWAEVRDGLREGTLPPFLLAEPTEPTGHLDPAALVTRLESYERAGLQAMPADLQQALLRLPRAVPPEVVGRARALTSPAGRAAVNWMDGGRPTPLTTIDWPDDGLGALVPRVQAPATGLPLIDLLFAGPEPHPDEEHGGCLSWWPYVMPSDREVVAQHYLPHLRPARTPARGDVGPGEALALAATGGPPGEGVALVLAHVVAERVRGGAPERRAAPVVELAARGELDGAGLGRQLGRLLRRGWCKPGPALETLEAAAALGAYRQVWEVVTGLLETFLPGPEERPAARHAQVLAFALRAARWAGARGAVPRVAEAAARRASNNFVREARRLHTYLT